MGRNLRVKKSHLLATKFHRPTPAVKGVTRPHLIERLNEGLELERQMTLVSAPAGFGKTTCVSAWLETLDGWPVAWLSLDPEDDDPGRFFTYLIAALQKADATLGREIEAVLRSGHLPSEETIGTTLVEDILRLKSKFLLVLDDFHVIQDVFILKVLEKLLTNPPRQLHLVLITREDPPLPLAQLRAQNCLTEIRAKDLRFSSRDIAHFLNQGMGLNLSQVDIAQLEDKTEGWIVGLQLAGLSIRGREDPSGFVATFSGSHRHILGYLSEQVLNRQPEEVRRFLLRTSILDKLNGGLCDAVTHRNDSHFLLERLLNANLFLIPLDDEGQWYRYHHLFRDLLRNVQTALQEDQPAELHRRASQWYNQAGMASEAVQHALAAEDYPAAVDLLERHASEMIMQGYAKTVNAWVQSLPATYAGRYPRTTLAFAWAHVLRGAYAQAAELLTGFQASSLNASPGEENTSIQAEWHVLNSLLLYRQGKTAECMDLATRALALAPRSNSRLRSLAYFVQASVFQVREEFEKAAERYRLSIQHGRTAGNFIAEMLSTVGLAGMRLDQGQLHLAYELASQAVARIERSGIAPPISAVVYAALGDVHYQWHQLQEARRPLLRALNLSALGGSNTVTIFVRVLLSRQYQMEGILEAAAREIREAADLIPAEAPAYVRQEVTSRQVRLSLAQGRPAAAEIALQEHGFSFAARFSFPDLPKDKSLTSSLGLLYNSSLLLLLYQAQDGKAASRLKTGADLAGSLIERALHGRQLPVALESLLIRAQMHAALGDRQASRSDYEQALDLAEPEGFISIFVEGGQPVGEALLDLMERDQLGTVRRGYLERILKAFSDPTSGRDEQLVPVSSAGTGLETLFEPLTERELEVLEAMTEGLKYKEIAEKLFISPNTVRYHVKAIYRKLGVNNRTQAIARARQLQIL